MRWLGMLVMVVLALAARGQPPPGLGSVSAAPIATDETLVGTWNGHWTSLTDGTAKGSVELILARALGADGVLGQFTFVTGATARTVRYQGRIENGTLRFPLVGDGRIVLEPRQAARPGAAATLQGEWFDTRGALPAPQGVLHLERLR